MNREIRFRGLDIKKDVWRYGFFYQNIYGSCIVQADADGGCTWHMVKSETVGQFTSLKDCNQKDIYVGDVIQYKQPIARDLKQYHNILTKEVPNMYDFGSFWSIYCLYTCDNIEIIGNIHTK